MVRCKNANGAMRAPFPNERWASARFVRRGGTAGLPALRLDLVGLAQIQRRNRPLAMAAAHRAPQAAIEVGMRFLEVADDLEIDALHLREIDLLDVHQPQELAHGLRHFAAALVARAATLRNADLRPELFLIQT